MIELTTERFAGIECLHAAPAGQRRQRLPTLVFYHGFTSSKEVYAYFAVALAQAGFRAVMPDADMHGARYNGDAETRLRHFWDILKQNIDEFPAIEAALRADDLIADARFAVAGASMGGMTALGIMARYSHIHSVACMMGSGYFMQLSHTLFPPVVVTNEEQKPSSQHVWRRWRTMILQPGCRTWRTGHFCCGTVMPMKWCLLLKLSAWIGHYAKRGLMPT